MSCPFSSGPVLTYTSRMFRRWVRTLPCCRCGQSNLSVTGHHVRYAETSRLRRNVDYNNLVPLCFDCHQIQHESGELFWDRDEPESVTLLYIKFLEQKVKESS